MFKPTAQNPAIPTFLRLVTAVECLVVFATAAFLFFIPDLGSQIWAWAPPPFNARYVGAIYFAALAPLLIFAITGRWVPGRLVLWMIFGFTTSIMVVMFIHASGFLWDRWATYAFWFLYLFLPLNSAVHLYQFRQLALTDSQPNPEFLQNLLVGTATLCSLYGLGLLLIPTTVTSFWPWPVDEFHGRIYAATYLTPAVGAFLINKKSAPAELFTLGITLAILGVLSILGVLITSPFVPASHQVNFASLGTWLFFAMNLITAGVGASFMQLGFGRAKA